MDMRNPAPRTVVVVDDDPELLRALRFSLELEGFAVESFADAAAAEAADLPRDHVCLIIDYFLPDKTGLELLSALRAGGVTAPAIIVTSNAGTYLRNIARGLDASVIEKPLLGPELTAEIHRLMPA